VFNFTWLRFSELLTFNIGFRLTPISVMMLIVITTVSSMVHIYSFGYMAERDEHYKLEEMSRFPAFLRLPVALHHVDARSGGGHQHLPDVYVLELVGWAPTCSHRLLLSQARCRACLKKAST
jgi:hypothetical protein